MQYIIMNHNSHIRQTDITGRPRDTATEIAHEKGCKLDEFLIDRFQHRSKKERERDFAKFNTFVVTISCIYSEMHGDYIWTAAFRMANNKPKYCFQELTLNKLLKSVEEVCKSEVIFILI